MQYNFYFDLEEYVKSYKKTYIPHYTDFKILGHLVHELMKFEKLKNEMNIINDHEFEIDDETAYFNFQFLLNAQIIVRTKKNGDLSTFKFKELPWFNYKIKTNEVKNND